MAEKTVKYIEGISSVKDLIYSLSSTLINGEFWDLAFPSSLTGGICMVILHTKIKGTSEGEEYNFYLKLERETDKYNHLYATIGTGLNEEGNDLIKPHSPKVRCAWYKENEKIELHEWLPVKIWMNYSSDFVNIILQGDDAVDIPPNYDNFLTSFLLLGTVESYRDENNIPLADVNGNFFITAGSDIMPERSTEYGLMTGNGNTDIIMVGTRTGVPYQGHDSEYTATSPFVRKNWIKESAWTLKYHVSPIHVWHRVDRERGKIQGLLIGAKDGLNQTNLLTLEEADGIKQTWQFFSINAPYKFINNGPNPTYGLFLLMNQTKE